jgi:hypothetical protein
MKWKNWSIPGKTVQSDCRQMTLIKQLFLASTFTMLVADPAGAQFVQTAATAPGTSEPWSLSAGVDGTYEDNVQLTSEGSGSLGSVIHGGLGRNWAVGRGRGDVRLNGDASQTFYRDVQGLNQFNYGGNIAINYAITRRLAWTLGDSVRQGYAQDAALLIDQGVVLPKVLTLTNVATTQLAYELSPRSQLQWGLSTQRAAFTASNFADGSQFETRLSYSHQVGRNQRIGILQDYQRSTTEGTTETHLSLQGTWQRPIGRDSGVTASGGIQPYTLSGVSGFNFAPTFTAAINTHVRQTDTVSLSYARTIEQAFGFGHTYESHNVSASYALSLTRKLGLDLGGNYGRSRDPIDPEIGFTGKTASAALKYAVSRDLMVSGSYNLFSRTEQPTAAVTSSRMLVSLTYGKTWR